jgi:hypothetical protein
MKGWALRNTKERDEVTQRSLYKAQKHRSLRKDRFWGESAAQFATRYTRLYADLTPLSETKNTEYFSATYPNAWCHKPV